MGEIRGLFTAMVTPFRADGSVNDEAGVALARHLLDNGSHGLVICGTTGEATTLTDEEHVGFVRTIASELGDEAPIFAGAGSNDTRHAAHLTEAVVEAGAQAVLSVTPYYNKPNRRGLIAHFSEVARAASGRPVILYNIPSRTALNMPPDLLAELAQIDGIDAVKQSNGDELGPIDGLSVLTGNDEDYLRALELGCNGLISVAAHVAGNEMRRMFDEPDARAEIDAVAAGRLRGAVLHGQPDPGQGRAEPARPRRRRAAAPARRGQRRGAGEGAGDARAPRAAQRSHRRVSGTLRVLPLGGVGEIGKNMTVVEYDGRIVVVDCGLRFPTADMMGIDLVLPDFTYLREHIEAIEAIVITHGHEDHLGALPWVLRELGQDSVPVVYGGQLTVAMARSKLDEHKLREVNLEVLPIGDRVQAGPFTLERIHLTHSIPDAGGVALTTPARDRAVHRRLQVRPDAGRRRARRHGAAGRDGPRAGCCCCAATPRTPTARASPRASRSSARTSSASSTTARAGSW